MIADPTAPSAGTAATFRAAGVTFMPGYPDNLHRLHGLALAAWGAGESVACVLIRNPDNPVDRNAIEIHVPSIGHVGMVPGEIAYRLAPKLDAGLQVQAAVIGVAINLDHTERPGLQVALTPARSEKP